MEERLVRAFSTSAEQTFNDMFGLKARAEAPILLSEADDHGWDITGLVGLAGQGHGVVAVRLTTDFVGRLLAGTGVEAGGDGERRELEGGLVGELTNIIAGKATSLLEGLDIEIAPPVVIRGPKHRIGWPGIAPVIKLAFSLQGGAFEVDLCMKI
jgi:CheY-specific phosphatase CheX